MPYKPLPSQRTLVHEEPRTINGIPAKIYVYGETYKRLLRSDYDGRHVRVELYIPHDDNHVRSEYIHDRRYGKRGLLTTALPSKDQHIRDCVTKAKSYVDDLDGIAQRVGGERPSSASTSA